MWRERLDGEHFDRKEKRRHKAERRESHHKRRSEKRRLKEPQEVENCSKRSKLEDCVEAEVCEAIAGKKSQDAEEQAISAPQTNYTANVEHRSNPACSKQDGLSFSFGRQQKAQLGLISPSMMDEKMDLDENEILAMEKQIANIQESKLVLDTKTTIEHEICRESVHAACNLERELNGEQINITFLF
ncbi:unnamed protein product [Cylicostephanus goldi]|uniref:Uncharacterized protein n=1 Tax=Cylicostephanus goldi TaxID=71465 RepID=A0A3P6SFW2_CYLGO|nr:unnamed protein product [Cylicostephanus goldi]